MFPGRGVLNVLAGSLKGCTSPHRLALGRFCFSERKPTGLDNHSPSGLEMAMSDLSYTEYCFIISSMTTDVVCR